MNHQLQKKTLNKCQYINVLFKINLIHKIIELNTFMKIYYVKNAFFCSSYPPVKLSIS